MVGRCYVSALNETLGHWRERGREDDGKSVVRARANDERLVVVGVI